MRKPGSPPRSGGRGGAAGFFSRLRSGKASAKEALRVAAESAIPQGNKVIVTRADRDAMDQIDAADRLERVEIPPRLTATGRSIGATAVGWSA